MVENGKSEGESCVVGIGGLLVVTGPETSQVGGDEAVVVPIMVPG